MGLFPALDEGNFIHHSYLFHRERGNRARKKKHIFFFISYFASSISFPLCQICLIMQNRIISKQYKHPFSRAVLKTQCKYSIVVDSLYFAAHMGNKRRASFFGGVKGGMSCLIFLFFYLCSNFFDLLRVLLGECELIKGYNKDGYIVSKE